MKIISLNKGSFVFILGLLLWCTHMHAHYPKPKGRAVIFQSTVTGTITDATGPLPGVTIMVKGSTTGTVSDASGKYTITAGQGEVLVFAFIGYRTEEKQITSSTIDVLLIEDSKQLEELVINAGYYNVKEKERTGSIVKVTAKDIQTQPVSNPLAALQGRMSGVSITQTTGTPGSGFSIQIRGINSLRSEGNAPLYIINGVPYASQSMGSSDVGSTIFGGLSNPLSNLNPADIESIEVLKDADATAIYGSRGANGVVLITTKKGKAGKTAFDLQAYTTMGKASNRMDLLNTEQYLSMRREAFANDNISNYPANAYDVNGTWDPQKYTDWQEELIGGTATVSQVQLTTSGGSEQTQFLVGGTMRRESTVFPGDAYFARGAVNTSINHRSSDDRFGLDFSGSYTSDKNTLPGVDLTRQAYMLAPNAPDLYDAHGNINWEDGTFNNPLGYLNSEYENKASSLIANMTMRYKLPYSFTAKLSMGYTDARLSETRTLPASMYNPVTSPSSAYSQLLLNEGKRSSWIIEPQLDWEHKSEDFRISTLVGATFQSSNDNATALEGFGFPTDALIHNLAAASTVRALGVKEGEYRYNALFCRLNTIFKDRYILNLTGRRDASSRFGPENRSANFGAVGAAWIFTAEPWTQRLSPVLSFGKLRASYGVTGNDQIGDYQYLNTYEVDPQVYSGSVALTPARLYNPDFGWETNHKQEAALELGFFKDRIFVSAAAYRNRSSSQLVGMPLPGTTGFSSIQYNLDATVENRGLELEWHSSNIQNQDFKWDTTFNIAFPENELIAFPGLDSSPYRNTYLIGHSLSTVQLYNYSGISAETGVYTFTDANGDGQLTAADDRVIPFDTMTDFFGGLGNKLTYKNWTLDFLFQFVKQDAMDPISAFPASGFSNNQPVSVLNHWPQDGTDAKVQRYTSGGNFNALLANSRYIFSDAMIVDASFIRLKTCLLAYDFTPAGTDATIRAYLQGHNLLTFTRYKGPDPESRSVMYLPPLRQLTFGVQLRF